MRTDHIMLSLMTRSGRIALARQLLDPTADQTHPSGALQGRLTSPEQSARRLETYFASVRSLDGSDKDLDHGPGRVELHHGESAIVYRYSGDGSEGLLDVSVEDPATTTLERYRFSHAGVRGASAVVDHLGPSLSVSSKNIDRLRPAESTDAELYVFLNGENPALTDPSRWLLAT